MDDRLLTEFLEMEQYLAALQVELAILGHHQEVTRLEALEAAFRETREALTALLEEPSAGRLLLTYDAFLRLIEVASRSPEPRLPLVA